MVDVLPDTSPPDKPSAPAAKSDAPKDNPLTPADKIANFFRNNKKPLYRLLGAMDIIKEARAGDLPSEIKEFIKRYNSLLRCLEILYEHKKKEAPYTAAEKIILEALPATLLGACEDISLAGRGKPLDDWTRTNGHYPWHLKIRQSDRNNIEKLLPEVVRLAAIASPQNASTIARNGWTPENPGAKGYFINIISQLPIAANLNR